MQTPAKLWRLKAGGARAACEPVWRCGSNGCGWDSSCAPYPEAYADPHRSRGPPVCSEAVPTPAPYTGPNGAPSPLLLRGAASQSTASAQHIIARQQPATLTDRHPVQCRGSSRGENTLERGGSRSLEEQRIGGYPFQAGDLVAGPTGIDPVSLPDMSGLTTSTGRQPAGPGPELRSRALVPASSAVPAATS